MWEGPPYRPHSLGDGSKFRRGKGLKTVCIAPTRTSVSTIPKTLCDALGFCEFDDCSLNLHLADSTIKKPM